uniref:Uncharacterized protein n=1 Tax=Rhizophagus irregularis (strain DAOM 181602 / DAOM 197198 / MUCL 43194) TaxID=747089 RepID=U9UUG6_RHIID
MIRHNICDTKFLSKRGQTPDKLFQAHHRRDFFISAGFQVFKIAQQILQYNFNKEGSQRPEYDLIQMIEKEIGYVPYSKIKNFKLKVAQSNDFIVSIICQLYVGAFMKDIEIDRGQSAADGERNTDSEHLEMAE